VTFKGDEAILHGKMLSSLSVFAS